VIVRECKNGMKGVKREERLSVFNNATLVKVLEPLSDEDGYIYGSCYNMLLKLMRGMAIYLK